MPGKIGDTLFNWEEAEFGARNRDGWRIIPACIWWTIWRERNTNILKIAVAKCKNLNLTAFCCSAFGVQRFFPISLKQF